MNLFWINNEPCGENRVRDICIQDQKDIKYVPVILIALYINVLLRVYYLNLNLKVIHLM